MKILSKGMDGGNKSNVTGFWLIEAKSLFSIVLLRFGKGSRENYHNHAFNAWTFFLKGEVDEEHLDGRVLNWKPSWKPKYTPRECFHKVFAKTNTYALSFRGPWSKTWKEYDPVKEMELVLKSGRRIISGNRRKGMSMVNTYGWDGKIGSEFNNE